jgi:hypoxanthine phosphoribosyltransferase
MLEKDIERILVTEEELSARISELASQINRDYSGRQPLLVGVLRGSFVFLADLVRKLDIYCSVEFMGLSSYGSQTSSSGAVQITRDLPVDIEGRDILIVEDILDSGHTLAYLVELLKTRHPSSIRICVLLDKPSRRKKAVSVDYVGFSIPDDFVVGYGLDYAELYRNLPYIGVLKPSVYRNT